MKQASIPFRTPLVLSFCAVLAFLWSALLDMSLVYAPLRLDMQSIGIGALVFTMLIGAWLVALGATLRGSRRGLMAALGFAVLLTLYALMDWAVYCPDTCARLPIYYVANALNLGFGLAGAIALAMALFRARAAGPG